MWRDVGLGSCEQLNGYTQGVEIDTGLLFGLSITAMGGCIWNFAGVEERLRDSKWSER